MCAGWGLRQEKGGKMRGRVWMEGCGAIDFREVERFSPSTRAWVRRMAGDLSSGCSSRYDSGEVSLRPLFPRRTKTRTFLPSRTKNGWRWWRSSTQQCRHRPSQASPSPHGTYGRALHKFYFEGDHSTSLLATSLKWDAARCVCNSAICGAWSLH